MPYITIGTTSQLQIKAPTRGTENWDETMRTDTWTKIAEHDHSGSSGKGIQLSTGSIAADAITGAKIRLDNNESLRSRNQADSADVDLLKLDANDELILQQTIGSAEFQDDGLTVVDNADNTKKIALNASGITTSTTRTLSSPDANGTLVLEDNTATLTNKTLTTPTLTSPVLNTGVSGTAILDEDNMASDSATQLATQQSIKAYVDAQVTAQDLDLTSDSGTIAIDLDSETLTVAGAQGISTSAATNTLTLTLSSLDADVVSLSNVKNADIKAGAAIALDKLATVTASKALESTAGGVIQASSVTSTELGYVSGVTSAIQTQIDSKLPTTITTTGDIIYSSSGSTAARLGIGSAGEVLTVSGGVPSWSAVSVSPIAVTQQSSTYTALTSDEHIECTANSFTVTLYAVSTNSGRKLTISNTGTGVITIDPNASETFNDGSSAKYLSQDQSIELQCNGSEWIVKNYTTLTGFLKEVQTANTAGGTFTSGSWQTRTLNTSSGDFTKFGSLSSNQFTLEAGTYIIEAKAPFYECDRNKAKLRNTSDSTDDIIGISTDAGTSNGGGHATVEDVLTITSSKTFEIQHRCASTSTTNGLGLPTNVGVSEVYTTVKIKKIA